MKQAKKDDEAISLRQYFSFEYQRRTKRITTLA